MQTFCHTITHFFSVLNALAMLLIWKNLLAQYTCTVMLAQLHNSILNALAMLLIWKIFECKRRYQIPFHLQCASAYIAANKRQQA